MLKNSNKLHLKLYDYQQNLINQIDNNKNILLGACPRTGKTYIIAGYINKNKEKFKNILVITPCPKETLEQWEEIYNNYIEFDEFNIFKIETSKELIDLNLNEKNIIIISKQLLQINYKDFDFKPNLLIFDEHDFHGTSELSKDIIKKYSKVSQNIYLTGTYYKSLYNIKNPKVILYNYYDLHKDNPNTPEQIYLTSRFNKNIYKEIKLNNLEFNFNLLFSLNNKNNFEYEEDIKYFIHHYITNDIINRIKRIYDIYEQKDNKYTQLWFLPENNIDTISRNLVKILIKNNYYRNFDILTFNSKNYYLYETKYDNIEKDYKTNEIKLSKNTDIKDFIKKQEEKIKINSNKFGLLILVGGMLQRGISLNHINTIFFLNESESYAKYLQSTYRCLTEEKDKKIGIIIDFNINRILSLFINYNDKDEKINKLNIDNKIKYMIDNNMINLDIDKLINEDINNKMVKIDEHLKTFKFDGQKSLQNILDKWNENPINQLNIFKKLIEDTYENLDLNINYELLKIFKSIDDKELKKINKNIENKYELVNEENIDKQIINKTPINKKEKIKVNKEEIENIKNELIEKKKLTKDILPYIIPLSCILTYDNNEKQFINILNYIKNNKILKEIFNNQCKTIWDKSGLLDIFIQIIEKLDNLENINNYISKIKYNINKLIDNPEELLLFINECLIIKSCEVVKNGEVMMPSWLINDILNKFEEIDKDIFKKKLTWFDPCCGMGNFHIEIYKRLIKYHTKEEIIKEMFYGNEINSKNVFLYKMIFGKNSNINCSNSLELEDIKYDIIIGNPPYNSGTKNSGNTIYQKFIEKFIKNYNVYFSFITPPGWRKPMDENCLKFNLYNLMSKDNHLNYLSIHDTKDGLKTFNAGTRYDWYIIDKNTKNKESIIYGIDKKEYKIKCNEWLFIPNGKLDLITNIFDFKKKNNLNIVCSRSDYDPRQKYVSNIKTKEFKYELLHSTPKNGPIYKYTSNNTKCGFNISKIIFGESGINKIIIDKEGKYGLTNGCIGINIKDYNDIELNKLIKVLESNKFKDFLKYFSFSIFRIEWRIFTYLKKDFYEYF